MVRRKVDGLAISVRVEPPASGHLRTLPAFQSFAQLTEHSAPRHPKPETLSLLITTGSFVGMGNRKVFKEELLWAPDGRAAPTDEVVGAAYPKAVASSAEAMIYETSSFGLSPSMP